MRIDINVTAIELEALRRAIAGLLADERARFLGRPKRSKIELACDTLYEKIFERHPYSSTEKDPTK
jgi:hypothetical protein